VARNRTVRLAVLGSSVQRAASAKYPSKARPALLRRVVAGVLVVLSLVMITLSFRASPDGGGLESIHAVGATVLRPFEVGIARVVQPFRDLYGYGATLVSAKEENDRLRAELREARQAAIQNQAAAKENTQLRKLLDFRAPPSYGDFDRVAAAVVTYPPSRFEQKLVIAAGANDGIRVNDPVVNGDGLVGRITKVAPRLAQVTLLTDEQSAVTSLVVGADADATGIVKRDRTGSNLLVMDGVGKDRVVEEGNEIVTAGSRRGRLPSLYPRGIPIGKVTFVGQTDIDPYKRIQIEPAVDFGSVDAVIVLVPKTQER
jgi:rod shape-determining protein MreC